MLAAALTLCFSGWAWSQEASIRPGSIEFGKTPLYETVAHPKLKNILTITNLASSGPALVVTLPASFPSGVSLKLFSGPRDAKQFSFGPLASVQIEIDYSPVKDGRLSGSLVFTTNDPKHPQIKIRLKGSGVGQPPNVLANPPTAIFLGDADGSDNIYTDSAGHSGDAVVGPGVAPNSPHYGGVTLPLAAPLPGHALCDGEYADNPKSVFQLFGGLVVGGGSFSDGAFTSLTSDIEAYDPCTKTFSTVGQLATPVAWPAVTPVSVGIIGHDSMGFPIYASGFAVVGGLDSNAIPSLQGTLIWQDPSTGSINVAAKPRLLSTGRVYANAFGSGQTATGFPDPMEFLVAGGIDSSGHVADTFEIVCGAENGFCDSTDIGATSKLTTSRAGAVATSVGGGVVLMGGIDDSGTVLSSTEFIAAFPNPQSGKVSFSSEPGGPLSAPRAFASSVSFLPGFPFLIGGLSDATFSSNLSVVPVGPPLSSTETFNCAGFQAGPPLNTARFLAGTAFNFITSEPVLIVAGGIGTDGQPVRTVEIQRNALEPEDPGATGCSPPLYEPFEVVPGTTSVGHPAPMSLTPTFNF